MSAHYPVSAAPAPTGADLPPWVSRDSLLQVLLTASGEGLCILDGDRRCAYVSQSGLELLGYARPDALIGRPVSEWLFASGRGTSEEVLGNAGIEHAVRTRAQAMVADALFKHADGRKLPVECWIDPLTGPQGVRGTLLTFLDTTRRKRAELRARHERDRAQRYLDIAGVILVVIDHDQTVSLINREGTQVLGLREDEIRGKNWFDHFLPEGCREAQRDLFLRIIDGEQQGGGAGECEVATATGATRLVTWTTTVLRDAEGIVTATLSSGSDITQRERAETKLRDSERRFRTWIEHASDLTTILGADGTILFDTPSVEKVLGFEPEEVRHQNLFDFVHPQDVSKVAQALEEAAATPGRAVRSEYRHLHRDGSWHTLETIHVCLTQGAEGKQFIASSRDVTERKRAEVALEESRRALSTLLSNLPGLAYRARNDRHWTMQFVSQGCFELTGYHPDDLIGNRRISYHEIIHPDDRQRVEDSTRAALADGRAYRHVYRIITATQ